MQTKILVGVVVLVGLLFWVGVIPGVQLGSGGEPIVYAPKFEFQVNIQATTTGRAAKLILAGNSAVQLRCFANTGSTTVALGFGTSTGLSASSGFILAPGSASATVTYTFTGDSLYTGDVYAYSLATGTPISICQL